MVGPVSSDPVGASVITGVAVSARPRLCVAVRVELPDPIKVAVLLPRPPPRTPLGFGTSEAVPFPRPRPPLGFGVLGESVELPPPALPSTENQHSQQN